MQRLAIVGLLLPHRGRTDLCRVPDPQLLVIFLEQSFKPLSVHRGFRPDVSRTSKRRVKRPCLTVPMFQPTLGDLSYFSIDRCKLLKPRVKITNDNYHRSAPFFRALVESQPPSLLGPEGADDLIQSVLVPAVPRDPPTSTWGKIPEHFVLLIRFISNEGRSCPCVRRSGVFPYHPW